MKLMKMKLMNYIKKIIKDNSTIKDCFVNKNIYDKKIFIVPFKWRVF